MAPSEPQSKPERELHPLLTWVAAPLAVVALLGGGLYLFAGLLVTGRYVQIAVGVVWFLVASWLVGRVWKARPELKVPVRGAFLATAVIASFGLYWTSFRDTTVDEQIVDVPASSPSDARAGDDNGSDDAGSAGASDETDQATKAEPEPEPMDTELASGSFRGADNHAGSGKAELIKLADGGRRLQFRDFDVDPGPTVVVRLTPGPGTVSGSQVVELGELKGTKGNQSYTVPKDADLDSLDTVVIYCTPFSVRIAVAELS
ncbi:MAG: DM13 domain-containing protein [Solirubrobacterales bacterium]